MISKKLSIVQLFNRPLYWLFCLCLLHMRSKSSTLNRTVVVENEYNPNIMDASKINVLPRVEAAGL